MNKSGNASPTNTSVAILTGWTADGGYPGTSIVSNQLVIDRLGTVNVTARMVVSANTFGLTVTGYIYRNGVQIKTASSAAVTTLNLDTSGVSVSAGDTIDMRIVCSNSNGGITIAAAGTYLQFDPA